jgi:GxxExxY protein
MLGRLAYDVIGAAIEVHRELGPGYLESVYEKALCVELGIRKIPYSQQHSVVLDYKGHNVGEGRLDIIVDNCLVVEFKAVAALVV